MTCAVSWATATSGRSWMKCEKLLSCAKDATNWTFVLWSGPLFRLKQILYFIWKSWRKSGEAVSPRCLKSSVKPWWLLHHVLCWYLWWSVHYYKVKSQTLPCHFRTLHALICWQAIWRWTLAFQKNFTKWFSGHIPTGQPTRSHMNSTCWKKRQEPPNLKLQMSWRPLSKQPRL